MFGNLIPRKKNAEPGAIKVRNAGDLNLSQFRDELDSLWDRFWNEWRSGLMDVPGTNWMRGVNLEEEEKEFVLEAELPGFEPEEFEVKVSGNMLTLRAEHKEEGGGDGSHYRRYGRFCETFPLPAGVDPDKIDARYHSGVLEVHLPKSEGYETKRIPVTAA